MSAQVRPITPPSHRILGSRAVLLPGILVCLMLLTLTLMWSITLGAADITPEVVYTALFNFDPNDVNHIIIQTVRLPRVLSGVVVGAALAVAGAIMQGLTRNPLADSGLLGINSGASFAVVLAVFIAGGNLPLSGYALVGFLGAGVAAALVYLIGSLGRGGMTPLKLTLAGVILTSFLASFTSAILISDEQTLERIRFWTVGSLAGRDMPLLLNTAPYILMGLVGALLISHQLTLMSLGDDVATGLGQNTVWIKAIAAVIVVLLSGGAVALAGPIGFVGLVIPHVVRIFVGVNYRWIIPYSAVFGGLLITIGDVAARVIIRPQELPVGVMTALLGAPFFIGLARWKVKR